MLVCVFVNLCHYIYIYFLGFLSLVQCFPHTELVCVLFSAGFIDFIVDPSFQVMGDMLEKIIIPLQQRNAINEEGFQQQADKATSTTSLSSRPNTPGTPKSPNSPGQWPRLPPHTSSLHILLSLPILLMTAEIKAMCSSENLFCVYWCVKVKTLFYGIFQSDTFYEFVVFTFTKIKWL